MYPRQPARKEKTVKNMLRDGQCDPRKGTRPLYRRGPLATVVLLLAAALVAGCSGNPKVLKEKYLESGKRYNAEGKYREAMIQFSNAIKIDKNFAAAHYELSQTYVRMGDFWEAYTELQHTVDLQPTNYTARLNLGNLLLAGNKPDQAEVQANIVLKAQPNNPDVHALLSAIAVKHKDKVKALAEIHRALELDPKRAIFHENLALLLSGDPANSALVEQELKTAAGLEKKSVNAQVLLSDFYMRQQRWPEAVQASQSAISADPKNIIARETLAQAYFEQGNRAAGEQVLRQASEDLSGNPQGVRLLADYYVASGQREKAKDEFARLAAKYPSDLALQEAYVRALLQTGDSATARTLVEDLLKKHSKDPEVVALHAIVLIQQGNAGDAVNALQGAVRDSPQDAFLQFWLGKAALANGQSDLAERSFQEAIRLSPSNFEAQNALARIAAQRGDRGLLSTMADKMIATAPHLAAGYVWRAYVESRYNEEDKAEADLKTAIAMAPRDGEGYLALGKLRFGQKRYAEGDALVEQALKCDPDSVEALRLLVSYDLFMKQPDKALALINAQIEARPKNSGFYDLLAQYQVQNKKLPEAVASARKAIQINSRDPEAVMLYAQIEVMTGQTADAISVWQQWITAHPADAGAYSILGTLEDSSGNVSLAESYYRKALQIQSTQPIAANNLAYLMLEHGGDVDVALTLAQTARQALPDSPETADTLAWAYYHKGIYGFARDLLEDAVKTDPNDASMHYHLGMVYTKLQSKSDAETQLKRAISLQPGSPTAQSAQTALQGLS
jgi:Flp pilus assembly protein TadD